MDIRFKKRKLDSGTFEAASVFDVNNDGIPDIVCGEYWYEGRDFVKKHKICDIKPSGEYFDDFSDFGIDVNGDGYMDIVTGGWWGQTLKWRENPQDNGIWKTHDIDLCGSIETICFFDIDNCGTPEIFPNTPKNQQVLYKLVKNSEGKGTGTFIKYIISQQNSGHGMGFADINGDGRIDIVLSNGWLEQPKDGPFAEFWEFHPEYEMGMSASIPILGFDVTGNGLCDLIAGNAHGYGFYWFEQILLPDGSRQWKKHIIDEENAQYHDMVLADIDGDGEPEVITGKRYRAHCGKNPGDNDPVFIFYYKIKNGTFERHVIEYGEAGEYSGVGIYFALYDLDGNGKLDIVAPGKEGLFIFENQGLSK